MLKIHRTVLKLHQDVNYNGVETTLCKRYILDHTWKTTSQIDSSKICYMLVNTRENYSTNGDSIINFVKGLLQSGLWKHWGRFCRDFAGPLYCRDISTKNMHKCYILLFTCCVTRAVHLEVRVDANIASDILALDDLLLNEVGHIYLWEIILKVSNH